MVLFRDGLIFCVLIPNWDTNTNKYCIKIENKNGEEVSPHDYYKISFKVTENKEQEKTDAIREAFGNLHGAYSRKDENWREYGTDACNTQ